MGTVYVIIPTYNESENILCLIPAMLSLHIDGLRILIIDDNSPDGTGAVVEGIRKGGLPVEIIHRQKKDGLGSAYRIGFQYALDRKAEYIIEMDADLSHHPNDIPRLLACAEQRYECVIGSRRVCGGRTIGWPWHRRFMSTVAVFFARSLLGLKTRDVTSGFRCYRRSFFEKVPVSSLRSQRYAIQEEITFLAERHNISMQEIPITFRERKFGRSKLGWKEISEFFAMILRLYFRA
jgi:dolichol-phosphate mannosyltransferase